MLFEDFLQLRLRLGDVGPRQVFERQAILLGQRSEVGTVAYDDGGRAGQLGLEQTFQAVRFARDEEGEGTRYSRDQPPLPRDFVQQPPLIPHTIKGYTVTKNFNKCLDCHAWSRAKETGATKISVTHFKTREGEELSSVSPRRYFCNQCHVPQSDAKPLVGNTFKPGVGMR